MWSRDPRIYQAQSQHVQKVQAEIAASKTVEERARLEEALRNDMAALGAAISKPGSPIPEWLNAYLNPQAVVAASEERDAATKRRYKPLPMTPEAMANAEAQMAARSSAEAGRKFVAKPQQMILVQTTHDDAVIPPEPRALPCRKCNGRAELRCDGCRDGYNYCSCKGNCQVDVVVTSFGVKHIGIPCPKCGYVTQEGPLGSHEAQNKNYMWPCKTCSGHQVLPCPACRGEGVVWE